MFWMIWAIIFNLLKFRKDIYEEVDVFFVLISRYNWIEWQSIGIKFVFIWGYGNVLV